MLVSLSNEILAITCEIATLVWSPPKVSAVGDCPVHSLQHASHGHAVWNKNTDILEEPAATITIYTYHGGGTPSEMLIYIYQATWHRTSEGNNL